jgi:hypothetical protein
MERVLCRVSEPEMAAPHFFFESSQVATFMVLGRVLPLSLLGLVHFLLLQ